MRPYLVFTRHEISIQYTWRAQARARKARMNAPATNVCLLDLFKMDADDATRERAGREKEPATER